MLTSLIDFHVCILRRILPIETMMHGKCRMIVPQMPSITQHSTADASSGSNSEISERAVEGAET